MKYTIHLNQLHRPFSPPSAEVEGGDVICNDVMLPGEIDASCRFNPNNIRLWVIGHQFGAVCAIFASCEQNALDAAADEGVLDFCMAEDQEALDGDFTSLGNAGELFDLDTVWMSEAVFDAGRDILLITALARAAESGADTLE